MAFLVREPCNEAAMRAAPGRGVRRRQAAALAAAILGSTMVFVDGSAVNVALPVVQHDFATSAAGAQWVMESYALFLAALLLVGGALGDRYGRRRLFAIGIVIFTAASVLCAFSTSIGWLIAARAVQGIGGALLTPGSLALIGAAFGGEARGRAVGVWSAATGVTSTIGPLIGGLVVQDASWRLVFAINVPLALTALVLLRGVAESRETTASPLDWIGALLVTIGLGSLTYGLLEAQSGGHASPHAWVIVAAGLVALALFVARERVTRAPMVSPALFRDPTFSAANGITMLLYAAIGGALYFLPFQLIDREGYAPAAAGAALLPMIAVISLLSTWAGRWSTRSGARLPLAVGSTIAAFGFLLFAWAAHAATGVSTGTAGVSGAHGYWNTFFLPALMLGLGMALVVAPLTAAVLASVAPEHAGMASGLNNAIARAAGLVGIAGFGLIAAAAGAETAGFQAVMLGAACTSALSALVAVAIPRRRP